MKQGAHKRRRPQVEGIRRKIGVPFIIEDFPKEGARRWKESVTFLRPPFYSVKSQTEAEGHIRDFHYLLK